MNLDPRRSLQVTRYHTWPRIREQSVGEHSMQVMRILLAIYPDASRRMLIHCLVHDIGEVASGDPPYPVKKNNPRLKEECNRIERDAHLSMCLPWGLPPPQELNIVEQSIFKLAEFIEMMEWGIYEYNLGNGYAQLVTDRCRTAAVILLEAVPPDVKLRASRYLNRRGKHVSGPSTENSQSGRSGINGQGENVQGQLEEEGGSGSLHDVSEEVGPT